MKLYSDKLRGFDIARAFAQARAIDGQDIHSHDVREFRPRNGKRHGTEFFAWSLHGTRPTGHRPVGSYPLDDVDRAASWTAYGYVIARLFALDPDAVIGPYQGVADFRARVAASHRARRESTAFLALCDGIPEPHGWEKVSYTIMVDHDPGTLSEPGITDDNGDRFSIGDGPHPFSAGFPSPESADRALRAARRYVAQLGNGRVWLEKVTETIACEPVPGSYTRVEGGDPGEQVAV